VEDPEHKNVAVKIVREFREDVFIRPNESDYKIYMLAQDLGTEGQNALLKILEEPPKYGVFLLLTDNPEKLLPTVRSRCTQLALQALPEEVLRRELKRQFPQSEDADIAAAVFRSGGFLGQAKQLLESGGSVEPQTESFAEAFAARDSLRLVQTLVPMEKWKRDALASVLQSWLELMEMALACRSGIQSPSPLARQLAASRSSQELYAAAGKLKKAVDYCLSNVSPAAVCGYLAWTLRE
jgi:DNA polymerase-3 subunit delta'